MNQKKSTSREDARARRARQKRLGDQLKKLYDDVAQEPIPDDFLKLLEQADKQSRSSDDNDAKA